MPPAIDTATCRGGEGRPDTSPGRLRVLRGALFDGRVNVDVEVYCKDAGFKKFRCSGIPVDGWCFVADAVWSGTSCSSINAVSNNGSAVSRAFPDAIISGTDSNNGAFFDVGGPPNIIATPLP